MIRIHYVHEVELPSRFAAPVQILNTCRALAELGHEVTVYLSGLAGEPAALLEPYGLEPHPRLELREIAGERLGPAAAASHLAAELTAQLGPGDAVLARGEGAVRLLPRLAARSQTERSLLAYEAHRLVWGRAAEDLRARHPRLPRALIAARTLPLRRREHTTVAAADGLVALTPAVAEAMGSCFGTLPEVLVLPSGTGPPLPADERERRTDLIYVGKLDPRKGVELAVEAMAHLPNRRLLLLGGTDAEQARLSELASGLGLAERVEIGGWVPPAEVSSYLADARVGLCPLPVGVSETSERFTSSLKALEMMAHGVAVVSTDVPAMRELLGGGAAGRLVPPGDPRALAMVVEELLGDESERRRLVVAARERVLEYGWERRAARLSEFVEGLADRKSH